MELQRIGRYDIKSLIGQGGMSTVYLGYDPRSQREVAIKVLPPYYLHSTKFRERFEREALMIALLEHPAIVPVYDMGEEDGQPYIVMRYMSGGSLSDKLKKGPSPLRECVDMYLRLAPALDTAHARGVTHRDVKPDNLLFDKYDNVFLSDFGLARLRETIGFANISDGSVMGTPAYMSPEQIQGDRTIDGRSDVYSLGVVLYQMLCGTVPFSGTTAASVMMMHLVNPVPQIVEKNNTLPPAIQAVLEKAMAKRPDDRYQTVGEFARAIQAVTTGVHRRPSMQVLTGPQREQPTYHTPVPGSVENIPVSTTPPSVELVTPTPVSGTKSPTPAALPTPPEPVSVQAEQVVQPSPKLSPPPSKVIPLLKQRYILPIWGWIVTAAVLIILSLIVILYTQGIFPFTSSPGIQVNPGEMQSQNSSISQPAGTGSVSSVSSAFPGQADKLAFVNSSDIYVSNLNGSELDRLTNDGAPKSNLHWSPDGQSVIYTSEGCINLVGLQTHQLVTVTCFTGVSSIDALDISKDGQQVALGLSGTRLYLLPYDQLFNLQKSSRLEDIASLTACSYYAPYNTGSTIKSVLWSLTNSRLAMLLSTLVDGIYRDEVKVLDFSLCTAAPQPVNEILPTYFLFSLRGYFNHPEITGLSLKGNDQLVLSGYVNQDGFGDMYLYNLDQDQSRELSPNGSCCYRDAHWSPDGTYLFYSYQPETGGEVKLFYIPASKLTQTAGNLTALALPADFLSAAQASLQPALRTAH